MNDFFSPSRQREFQQDLRKGLEERSGYANVMFKRLIKEIRDFEISLNCDEEIGAYLTSFGGGTHLHIESIKYEDPYYIIFLGTIDKGQKARLVQHVTQTNILLIAMKVKPEENREPRRFGFTNPENEE